MEKFDLKGIGPGAVVALAAIALVLAAPLLDCFLDPNFSWWTYWGVGSEKTATKSEVVRNLGLIIGAIIGLGLAWWRARSASQQAEVANDQARITEQGQITDRYSKAVEMLSSKEPRTRVGAVYALARIAQDSIKRDHIPVMEVLSEFIRNPPYQEEAAVRSEARQDKREAEEQGAWDDEYDPTPPTILCPDTHAALNVLADRNDAQKAHEAHNRFRPDLTRATLCELDLERARLSEANLIGANLSGADLTGAFLRDANLTDANLSDASLSRANLQGAHLNDADLQGASLSRANLQDAYLIDANLRNAAHLTQNQINQCRGSTPPSDIPDDVTWPFVKQGRNWVKRK